MKAWHRSVVTPDHVMGRVPQTDSYVAGAAIGIITVNLGYPKMPGNVANPFSYDFPVLYEQVTFEIEQLFAGDPGIKQMIVDAALRLEACGVRAIVGACGYFAHFQEEIAQAVSVPVFMSSLIQVPVIELGLRAEEKILVMVADGESVNEKLLSHVHAVPDRLIVQNVGDLASFEAIRWSRGDLDNQALADDLCRLACENIEAHPEIGAVLLECSDLPPYAWAIQAATGKPVFDFQTMIAWVAKAILQRPYYGFC